MFKQFKSIPAAVQHQMVSPENICPSKIIQTESDVFITGHI